MKDEDNPSDDEHRHGFPTTVKPSTVKPLTENPLLLTTNILNTDKQRTELTNLDCKFKTEQSVSESVFVNIIKSLFDGEYPFDKNFEEDVLQHLVDAGIEEANFEAAILANHLCTLLFLGQITMPEYLKYAKILNCEKRKHIEPIEYFMLEDYKINTSFDWKKLFAKDYELANQIILEMHNAIKINKTMWLNLADAFNDLLIKSVVSLFEVILPAEKFPTIINKKGELLDFGVVLGNFDPSKCTNFLSPIHFNFKAIHDRRCSSPLSHPKDLKTLKSADFVNKREFPKFLNFFSNGCSQLLKLISPYM